MGSLSQTTPPVRAALSTVETRVRPFLVLATAFLVWVLPSKLPTLILIVATFLAALPLARRGASLWLSSPGGLAALAVAAYALLSLLWSAHPDLSARELAKDLPVALGLFALSVWLSSPEKIEAACLASASVLGVVLAADVLRLAAALGPTNLLAQARYFKPYWLTHPNTAGLLAVLTFWTGLYIVRTRWPCGRGTAWGLGIAIASLAHLFVMGSRGPQAALGGTAGAAVVLATAVQPRRRWWGLFAALLLAGLAVAAGPHLNARFRLNDQLAGRTVVWRQTWTLTRERPWLGFGYGKKVFEKVYYEDAAPPPPAPHHFPHPHHYFLFALFQGGRIGLVLRLALWTLLVRGLWKTLFQIHRWHSLTLLITLQILALHLYGLADFPDSQAAMALLALIVPALVLTRQAPERFKPMTPSGSPEHPDGDDPKAPADIPWAESRSGNGPH